MRPHNPTGQREAPFCRTARAILKHVVLPTEVGDIGSQAHNLTESAANHAWMSVHPAGC